MRKINMAHPFFDNDDKKRIHSEIDNILDGSLSMGKNVKAFELEFASRVGVKHSIAMNACTSTLEAALLAYGVKGKEVIIPSQTFIATGMAVHLSDAKPVFAEISPKTLCLELADVKKRVTNKTAGIIIVHMAGLITPDIIDFRQFCDENNLFLIEDAAHSPGAEINGKEAGSFGHAGCFSFFPSKVITSGEGGMLTTNDEKIAAYARSFQNRGLDMSAKDESYILPGRNVRMTELNALVGRVQLERLSEFLCRRRQLARIYIKELSGHAGIELIIPKDVKSSSFWKIPALLNPNINRSRVVKFLSEHGITIDSAYQPFLHMQPVIKNLYKTFKGQLPITEDCLNRNINLPCHPKLSDDDVLYTCNILKEVITNETKKNCPK